MWLFGRPGPSGFSQYSTAEQVTDGIDASGLTAIVTGGSSGIGRETARVLALRGAHVVMGVRNMAAGKQVQEAIVKEIPTAKVDALELDLSSMASVRKFASDFNSSGHSLNLLMHNKLEFSMEATSRFLHGRDKVVYILPSSDPTLALLMIGYTEYDDDESGIMMTPFMLSKDNIELQFATNHLGHFLLTHLLLDNMKKTACKSKKEGRIVNLSSEAHRLTYPEGICFDKINDEKPYNKYKAYGQSKLANILHANELTRQLKEEGVEITANSLHPGVISTNLFRHIFTPPSFAEGFVSKLSNLLMKNVQQGAATTCYVALHPQVNGVSGAYYSDSNLAKTTEMAKDMDLAKRLWNFSINLIK